MFYTHQKKCLLTYSENMHIMRNFIHRNLAWFHRNCFVIREKAQERVRTIFFATVFSTDNIYR